MELEGQKQIFACSTHSIKGMLSCCERFAVQKYEIMKGNLRDEVVPKSIGLQEYFFS
jgi:hypothetical protein